MRSQINITPLENANSNLFRCMPFQTISLVSDLIEIYPIVIRDWRQKEHKGNAPIKTTFKRNQGKVKKRQMKQLQTRETRPTGNATESVCDHIDVIIILLLDVNL